MKNPRSNSGGRAGLFALCFIALTFGMATSAYGAYTVNTMWYTSTRVYAMAETYLESGDRPPYRYATVDFYFTAPNQSIPVNCQFLLKSYTFLLILCEVLRQAELRFHILA